MSKDFFVVGIGASAGGLDAIQQLFDHLPADSGNAYVIVQHLSPDFKSLMPELLAKHTPMPIYTAEDNMVIEPNCIYLNQRNKNLVVKSKLLKLTEKEPKNNLNLPIDIFFHSLGHDLKERSIGIILSGTGTDGSRGVKTIKEAGGIILVQDPSTAQFDGMPNSAIATNLPDFTAALDEMAELVVKIGQKSKNLKANAINLHSDELVLNKILELVHKSTGIDFTKYKKNTLIRRLEKRLSINHLDFITDYFVFLNSNPKEQQMLKQDFLIGVTSFFRDTEAFNSLKKNVIPNLVDKKESKESIRVWVAGCSTGEEAYSIAILLDEHIKKYNPGLDFKIFATDIDSKALALASLGEFKVNIIQELDRNYLDNYFVKTGDKLTIIKRIREKIVFSNHDIIKDPPFIRMDLISCRNLLIYLDNFIQKKVMHKFHFSLNKFGYLFLGNSESLGEISSSFEDVDSKWKIYQNINDSSQIPQILNTDDPVRSSNFLNKIKVAQEQAYTSAIKYKDRPEDIFNNYLSSKFSPSSIFIDANFNILFIKRDAGLRLFHNEGVFQKNLLRVVSPDLAGIIRAGIRKVIKEKKDVVMKDVPYKKGDKVYMADLNFHMAELNDLYGQTFLIHFGLDKEIMKDAEVIKSVGVDTITQERLEELEEELLLTKSELQNVVEELETSNEELQSSNEELMASNEELQSTNEELQSVNEELYTVNIELQEKNKELEILNNDVSNLLDNTDIGILFLDVELNIRKFTPALKRFFNLQDSDIGRPISSFASIFSDEVSKFIVQQSKKALKSLEKVEYEINDARGNFSLIRIVPFVTYSKKIDGVIVNFIDINVIKKNELALKEKSEELAKAQEIADIGSWVLDVESGKVVWTKQLFEMFQLDPDSDPPHFDSHQKLFTPESWKTLSSALEKTTNKGIPYELELNNIRKDGSLGWMWVSGEAEKDESGKIIRLRGIAQDITTRKLISQKLEDSEKFAKEISELAPVGIHIFSVKEDETIFMNSKCEKIFGYSITNLNSLSRQSIKDLLHPEDLNNINDFAKKLLKNTGNVNVEFRLKTKANSYIWCKGIYSPFEVDPGGKVKKVIGVIIDISENKKIEKELNDAIDRANAANNYKNQFLANMSHEIRTPINGIVGFSEMLHFDNLTNEQRERYLDLVANNSKKLLSLVNDIIDVSKMEVGQLQIYEKPTCLREVIEDLYKTFEGYLKLKKITDRKLVSVVPKKYTDLHIITDPNRLHQVMSNLISNSIKYSEKGTIEFGFEVFNKKLFFFVKDQGFGIPEDKIDLIFNRFVQLEQKDPGKIEGTGLGLSIVKGLLDLLGGAIEVESEVGVGTHIRFELPFNIYDPKPKKKDANDSPKRSKKKLKLLIAEDTEENIEYFKAIFQMHSFYTVHYAKNGQEAVDLYFKTPEIDLVLMDIRMSELDGVKAAKLIWEKNPEAKIIAQTAFAMSNDESTFLNEGFVDYISKPFSMEELLGKIEKWT